MKPIDSEFFRLAKDITSPLPDISHGDQALETLLVALRFDLFVAICNGPMSELSSRVDKVLVEFETKLKSALR